MTAFKATPVIVLLALVASACASGHHAAQPSTRRSVPSVPDDARFVASVQSSFWGKGFQFFPKSQTTNRCRIRGPVSERIEGTCRTHVAVAIAGSHATGALVTFTESWPARKFRTHGPPRGTLHHSWRFTVSPTGRVVRRGDSGSLPPQASD
jgi:hypothetical protein